MSKSQLGLPRAKENVYILHNLLTSGKKVKISNAERRLVYREEVPTDYGGGTTKKTFGVEYVYTNPQFNRMFAKLEDGREVDYDITFLDLCWVSFEEWESPEMKLEDRVLGIIQSRKEKAQKAREAGAYSYQSLPHPQEFSIEELELISNLLRKENK